MHKPALTPSRVAFTARSTVRFLRAANRAGLISGEGGPKAMLALAPNLARYHFTTAREVEQGAAAVPERTALIDDDGLLSYRQLRDQSRTLGRWLLQVQQDKGLDALRIGVMARNGRGIILPLAAKGYTGGTIFLLNIGSSPEQLAGIIAENNIDILFIDDEFADRIPEGIEHVTRVWAHTTRDHGDELTQAGIIARGTRGLPKLPLFPKHGDMVLMSSGTSGIPKGILRPEPKMPLVVAGYLEAMPFRSGHTIQMTASIFHTWGWSALNITLGVRGTVVTQRVFDPENVFRQLQQFRCDGMVSSPIFFKQMLDIPDNERFDTSHLKFIGSAGNALTPAIVERMHKRFGPILANIYGSTELALAAAADPALLASDASVAGRVPPGTILKIYDDNDNEVPQGKVGRIFLNNETALRGYTNPETPLVTIDGLVEMGDLGYFDEHGYLHVLSRNDDMIIVGGENVHPQSVTEVLERMPGIDELHSGGVDDPDTFKRIAVWVVPERSEAGKRLTAQAVRDWVRANLADHSIPRDVNFVRSLPRNATGKVVPRLLPESRRDS
ncbi:AMP-binding protein [Corynebacterium sp. HMSC074A01]|uniref:AMP-binding protein n=1 Tax=Corynebacterium sp. HMSC074A01 TaxID=1715030 RepID=UPI0008A32016|nr:AMP-binding protein [Corynebacterium sp. HMSC074A01]OHF36983.1 acyl-CoA synthetase [Corynebacterium sp. HMSC074A01]